MCRHDGITLYCHHKMTEMERLKARGPGQELHKLAAREWGKHPRLRTPPSGVDSKMGNSGELHGRKRVEIFYIESSEFRGAIVEQSCERVLHPEVDGMGGRTLRGDPGFE